MTIRKTHITPNFDNFFKFESLSHSSHVERCVNFYWTFEWQHRLFLVANIETQIGVIYLNRLLAGHSGAEYWYYYLESRL